MSPPVYGGEIPAPPKTWPTVIGVIMIIVAVLGLLQNMCGGVVSVLMPAIQSGMPAEANDDPVFAAQMDLTMRYMPFYVANAVILIVLGVLLLMAGISMLKRRLRAVKYSRIWAVARILWAIPAAVITYFITIETFKAIEQAAANAGQPMPAGLIGFMQMLGPVGAAVQLVVWCALPVFLLIWLSLSNVKNEVAKWL